MSELFTTMPPFEKRVVAHVLAHKMADYDVTYSIPKNWWQHLRKQLGMEYESAERIVSITRYRTYPDLPWDEKTFGRIVIQEQETGWNLGQEQLVELGGSFGQGGERLVVHRTSRRGSRKTRPCSSSSRWSPGRGWHERRGTRPYPRRHRMRQTITPQLRALVELLAVLASIEADYAEMLELLKWVVANGQAMGSSIEFDGLALPLGDGPEEWEARVRTLLARIQGDA